jgi:hypothetical protein
MRLGATAWALVAALLTGAWSAATGCGGTTIEDADAQGHDTGSVPGDDDAIAEDAAARADVELEPQYCEDLAQVYDEACAVTSHSLGPNRGRAERNNVLLVVEKSASLSRVPDAYGMSKWEALQSALSSALYDYRGFLSLGLELFPTSATDPVSDPIPPGCREVGRCCEMPTGVEPNVPVAEGEVALPRILEVLAATTPTGACPTTEALARAHAYFTTGPNAELPGDDYVLLVTDGLPNCDAGVPVECVCEGEPDPPVDCPHDSVSCCILNNPECLVDADTVDQINELRGAGISTIVIGLPDSEPFGDHLWEFADAGGYADASAISTYYAPYSAGTVSQLTDTLRRIASDLAGACEIPLLREVPNLNEVNVVVDCEVLPFGGLDGDVNVSQWTFDHEDPALADSIILIGPVCAWVSSEPLAQIDVLYGCPHSPGGP